MIRKQGRLERAWLFGYSLAFRLVFFLVSRILGLIPKYSELLAKREEWSLDLQTWVALRQRRRLCVLIFCSSAGEYEQAKPLIDRFHHNLDVTIFLVFFSVSGARYASVRGESNPFMVMPTDDPRFWRPFFAALHPDLCVVVRHELWPGFLSTARCFAKVALINGTADPRAGRARGLVKRLLLNFFDYIAVSSPNDREAFLRLGVQNVPLVVTGDTKFDRVIERARVETGPKIEQTVRERFGKRRWFVVGSAWEEEVGCVLGAYQMLRPLAGGDDWLLLIAPHDVCPQKIDWIEHQCRAAGIKAELLSCREPADSQSASHVLIIDSIGHLAELYSGAELVLVGGGMGGKVHNVLEPAVYGAYVAMGPRFHNSREAVMLEKEGLIEVVTQPEDLFAWWVLHHRDRKSFPNAQLANKVQRLAGAADRLYLTFQEMVKTS
jgi:3-deoxy-D-manno-octulosonic-acid transferase